MDPAEEVKPRIDDMLVRYQDRLRHGMDTTSVTDQLTGAVNLLPQEEQDLARGRGRAIRDNPAAQYKRLWPNHVDRDRLDAVVRTYAGLAAQVEALALDGEDLPAEQAASREEMRARAHSLRGGIEEAITKGEGLIGLERDQLRAVLADIDAGKTTVPAQLFADDRSAAAADAERSDEIARASAAEHRRELDEILSSGAVPAGAARSAHVDIASVVDAHNQLAAYRVNLADYTDRGVNDRLTAKLDTAGVPEVVRDRLTDYLDSAVTDAARLGQQARRIQDRWTSRREMVSATRTPEPVAYDSESRRAGLATALRGAGLTEDEIAQRMAADAGHAHPPSAAAKRPVLEPRLTQSGDGMAHLQRRSKGRGGPDQGR
ncbi:hypothetical protein Ntsu_81820 [Nocardia sp. IFM 10818]